MPTTITLMGAGGKMGCRITDNLRDSTYEMLYLEVAVARGKQALFKEDRKKIFERENVVAEIQAITGTN